MLLAEDIKTKELVDAASFTKTVRFAKVTQVYDADNYNENYGKVELIWLDTQLPVSGLVDVMESSSSAIYGCGIYGMPNVGDIAVCLPQNNGAPIVLGFINPNKFKATNASTANIEILGNLPKLRAGEYFIKGRAQSSIWFKNDGSVNIAVKNGESLSDIINTGDKNNNAKLELVRKVESSNDNNVFELNIGASYADTAVNAGCNTCIFTAGTYLYTSSRVNIPASQGVSLYNIPLPEHCELVSVNSATLYEEDAVPIKVVQSSNLKYQVSSVYASSAVNGSILTTHPCTLDSEINSAQVEVPNEIVSLIGRKEINYNIVFDVVTKSLKGGIRINADGDVFIDGRNVVLRSQNNKASLGLFDDGNTVLNTSRAQLGDVLGGTILLNRGGIILSAGSSESGDVMNCGYTLNNNLTQVFGPFIYFYVSGDLPLVRYDTQNNVFTLVSTTEYSDMSPMDKYRIYPRTYDREDTVLERGAFTEKTMVALMESTPLAPSYNTLRSL